MERSDSQTTTAPQTDGESDERVGMLVAGKYRLGGVIGRGAMGTVYVAELVEEAGRRVALKLLNAKRPGARAVRRFQREAQAAARIRSTHVARVLDSDVPATGEAYIAMEYLEGSDLRSVIAAGGMLDVRRVVGWGLEALEAIIEAHTLGIVHRDIKPANLFLAQGTEGRESIKVLDFGVSKLLETEEAILTETAHVVGTPAYISPEQLDSSKSVDARADVWSIGVVLFELLTGKRPFDGASVARTITRVLTSDPVAPTKLRADLPPALEQIVLRCLAKAADARFQSARDLAAALAQFGAAEATEPRGPPGA